MNLIKELVYRLRSDYTTEKLIKMGMTVGKNFKRMHGTILDPSHCWLITIGDNVTMAPRCHILCHDASTCYSLGYAKIGRVDIGNNVFIGAGTIVLPGVKIGNDVVIGAGSIVTKNIPNNSVVAGNPAKLIMRYDEFVEKNKEKMKDVNTWNEDYTLRSKNLTEEKKQEMKDVLLEEGIGFVE